MPMSRTFNFYVLVIYCCLSAGWVMAQPVLSTKQRIGGLDIYQDYRNKKLYYYAPPNMVLANDANGTPRFLLVQMRYTGTNLYNDKDYKGFLNLLQLTVELPPINTEQLTAMQEKLGTKANLKPLPIRHFNAELIIPLGDAATANEKYRKVSVSGLEEGSETDANAFWQERTFTMRLDNAESQLLWEQVETSKLAISFSYSFQADNIPGRIGYASHQGNLTGMKEGMEEGMGQGLAFDSTTQVSLVKANTFPIYIDTKKHPACLKKVDINEEVPPAYASFQVYCYDFADDLRPDLYKKTVEIKAYAAAKEYITTKVDFSRAAPEISNRLARFSYAVRLDKPLEYRVLEVNKAGEKNWTPWQVLSSWAQPIDVTTANKKNTIHKKTLDIEVDLDSVSAEGFQVSGVELEYKLSNETRHQRIEWTAAENHSLKTLTFSCDKDQPIAWRTFYKPADADIPKMGSPNTLAATDDYLFVRFRVGE